MTMEIEEFIDTYSDDIIYLQEGRAALLTHPLRRELKDFCDASFCRIFAVMMIGSIEAMLQTWQRQAPLDIQHNIDRYFSRKTSCEEKVQGLCASFQEAGINVDKEVFEDYLAIKLLRNVIVHARWNKRDKAWLEKRGFPVDTRKLTEEQWKRMQLVNENMMLYIALTGITGSSKKPSNKVIKLSEVSKRDDLGLVRKKDIPLIFWFNLERISELIYKDIERAAITEQYYWAKGLSENEVKEMTHEQRKHLFYLAGRKAGKDGFLPLVQRQELATEALDFWKEYSQLTFDQSKISHEDIIKSTETLRYLHQRGIYPKGPFIPWPKEMPEEIMTKMIQGVLDGYEPLTEEEIAFALKVGSIVRDIMPNITPVYLLVVQLPIVDPRNSEAYLEEGEKALAAMELHNYWYSYVERRSSPDYTRWAYYRQIREDFRN